MSPQGSHAEQIRIAREVESLWTAMQQVHADIEGIRGAMGGGVDVAVELQGLSERLDRLIASQDKPPDPVVAIDDRLDAIVLALATDRPPPPTQEVPAGWGAFIQGHPTHVVAVVFLLVLGIAILLGQGDVVRASVDGIMVPAAEAPK